MRLPHPLDALLASFTPAQVVANLRTAARIVGAHPRTDEVENVLDTLDFLSDYAPHLGETARVPLYADQHAAAVG